jgi:hypothetical protein
MNTNQVTRKTVMVRYKTTEPEAAHNETLIRAVFDELRKRAPAGFCYASYRFADGVTFMHVATLATPDQNPLPNLPAFKAFQERLKARCVEPPLVTELYPIDGYGSLA